MWRLQSLFQPQQFVSKEIEPEWHNGTTPNGFLKTKDDFMTMQKVLSELTQPVCHKMKWTDVAFISVKLTNKKLFWKILFFSTCLLLPS